MALTSRKETINSFILYFSIVLFNFLGLYILHSYCLSCSLFCSICVVLFLVLPFFVYIFFSTFPPTPLFFLSLFPPLLFPVASILSLHSFPLLIFSHPGFITGIGLFLARSFACYGFNAPLDISSPLFGPCHILLYCFPHPVTHCSYFTYSFFCKGIYFSVCVVLSLCFW